MDPRKILVVDDEPGIRLLISLVLSRKNYAVTTASGGEEALAIVGREKPDLILLDLKMPGLDGVSTLRILRENPATSRIPVILVTAVPQQPEKGPSPEDLSQGILTKPFDVAELERMVELIFREPRWAALG